MLSYQTQVLAIQFSWHTLKDIRIRHQAEKDAAMKQAESASRAAEAFMKSGGDGGSDNKDVEELKEALVKAEKEASAAKKDRDSMKAQSESLTKEYDR